MGAGAAAVILVALGALTGPTPAFAQAPHWKLGSRSAPTNLPLMGEQLVGENDQGIKGEGMIIATATNLGDANADGAPPEGPITITDQLPAGLEPTKVRAVTGQGVPGAGGLPVQLSCPTPFTENRVVCTFEREAPPFEHLELLITVQVTTSTPSEPLNKVTIEGGNVEPTPPLEQPLKIVGNGGATPFGVEAYELRPENEDGSPDTQGGSHPFQLTTNFDLNQTYGFYEEFKSLFNGLPEAPALQKDLNFRLPAGLIGDPSAVPQCSGVDFGALEANGINACPDDTAIGVASVTFNNPIALGLLTWSVPVFNLVPAPGEPAKFGFSVLHVPIVLDTSIRTGEDYGVTVSVQKTPEAIQVLGASVTLWGVPGDPSHDNARGWNCVGNGHWVEPIHPTPECKSHEFSQPEPFIDLPTSCTSPLSTTVNGDAWSGETLSGQNRSPLALDGCGELPFEPTLEVHSDEHSASTPTGGTVEVSLSQRTTLEPDGRAEADIRSTTLELPDGVEASAGAANGLETCSVGRAGFLGARNPSTNAAEHSEAQLEAQTSQDNVLETELATQGFTPEPATCPDAAKLGTVEIETPLLPHPLTGSVYLGSQDTNPFASPLALYLVATEEDPVTHEGSKVLVKLAGEVAINPTTGQLTSTFANTPPVPFEHLKLHLFNGPRASQATPAFCGSYHSRAVFTPWSGSTAVVAESQPEAITSGPNGEPCPGATLPFNPGSSAGTESTQAGGFTPFSLTIGHPDGNQALTGIGVQLPPGAAAMLGSVTPCPIARADAGACEPASQIGEAQTSSGLGSTPFTLPGEVYLTEGFDGAPFGVSVLTNAEAVGPFNIGKIIANSTIRVDPNTAAATITSVETRILESNGNTTTLGSLPTMIKGVPVQLKQVHVVVNRPNFEFNPTNCNPVSDSGIPMAVQDTLTGAEGGSDTITSKYGVTGCGGLGFAPVLTAEVAGQGSKLNGTSFTVKVHAAAGQANIAKTFLTIPNILPSRLSTIQKACPDGTFNANPAACDEGSVIGYAVARTPVLRSPLTGPAYLVSHGNAAFPDVEFVLQGEGVEIVLDGKTDIKNGVTYSRFETLPDAPVSSFETVLPAGPHSALTPNTEQAPNYNLCGHSITMPTEITGQNGAVIHQTTSLTVTGCGAVKSSKKTHLTPAQQLAKALKACRKQTGKRKRKSCEKRARTTYRKQMLALTLKSCAKRKGKKRHSCEHLARKRY
ncbi:MAG TPA: hypothetical protein VLZ06_02120 [Solirubrobacteraceae bacterium]|nr:hypothetical protein [Solirubrobacteraceae bacterium]